MSAGIRRSVVDFDRVAAIALARAPRLLASWFPLGRRRGDEFLIGNLRGDRGDSLAVSLKNGRWIDFARPSDRGGDIVSLHAASCRVSQVNAALGICAQLGVETPTRARDAGWRPPQPRPRRIMDVPAEPEAEGSEEQRRSIALALRIWAERLPLMGSPAATYLRGRGLLLDAAPDDLAFHPRCPLRRDTAPAMLALLRDARTGEPCGVHRTFLRPDGGGKADHLDSAKMMLGRAKGSVVMLSPSANVTMGLGVTEGIENGLTVLCRGWAPVWACGSAGGIGGSVSTRAKPDGVGRRTSSA
jgi:putative DNA primase/helicase